MALTPKSTMLGTCACSRDPRHQSVEWIIRDTAYDLPAGGVRDSAARFAPATSTSVTGTWVTTKRARVVVVTHDAALADGLSTLRPDWEVVAHARIDDDVLADVVVVDLDVAGTGLADAAPSSRRRAFVVIGDEPPAGPLPATTVFLQRPFTLDDVAGVIAPLLESSAADDDQALATDAEFPVLLVGGRDPASDEQDTRRSVRWPGRRRRDRRPSEASADGREEPTPERLEHGVDAARRLRALLDELPALASRGVLAQLVVDDVAARFDADTVGLWGLEADGWVLLAQVGFTKLQTRQVVPDDQPLFREIYESGGGILIDPVDRVRAAVAGVGGAHTASFMAGAVSMKGHEGGDLAVGRATSLRQDELDVLLGVADELAPGLTVAEELERLRDFASAGATLQGGPVGVPTIYG
jgi:hypothetical protein